MQSPPPAPQRPLHRAASAKGRSTSHFVEAAHAPRLCSGSRPHQRSRTGTPTARVCKRAAPGALRRRRRRPRSRCHEGVRCCQPSAPSPAMIASIKKTTFHRDVYEPAEVRGQARTACIPGLLSASAAARHSAAQAAESAAAGCVVWHTPHPPSSFHPPISSPPLPGPMIPMQTSRTVLHWWMPWRRIGTPGAAARPACELALATWLPCRAATRYNCVLHSMRCCCTPSAAPPWLLQALQGSGISPSGTGAAAAFPLLLHSCCRQVPGGRVWLRLRRLLPGPAAAGAGRGGPAACHRHQPPGGRRHAGHAGGAPGGPAAAGREVPSGCAMACTQACLPAAAGCDSPTPCRALPGPPCAGSGPPCRPQACKQTDTARLQVGDRVDLVLCDLASALLPAAEGRVDLLVGAAACLLPPFCLVCNARGRHCPGAALLLPCLCACAPACMLSLLGCGWACW